MSIQKYKINFGNRISQETSEDSRYNKSFKVKHN